MRLPMRWLLRVGRRFKFHLQRVCLNEQRLVRCWRVILDSFGYKDVANSRIRVKSTELSCSPFVGYKSIHATLILSLFFFGGGGFLLNVPRLSHVDFCCCNNKYYHTVIVT